VAGRRDTPLLDSPGLSTQDCGAERKIRPRILTRPSMLVMVVALFVMA
jgi:hypothetical protein